jgi:hypothetical protein
MWVASSSVEYITDTDSAAYLPQEIMKRENKRQHGWIFVAV